MKKIRTKISRFLEKVRIQISKQLMKIPDWILITIIVGTCTAEGCVVSKMNINESKLTKIFSMDLLMSIILLYAVFEVVRIFGRTAEKTYRAKDLDKEYRKYQQKALDSKMPDIQKVAVGKIFDTVSQLARMRGNIAMLFVGMIPFIIPYCSLVIKEAAYDWKMAAISVGCTLICFGLGLCTDMLFGWSKEVSDTKSALSAVTVDNFANLKTIKCLGQGAFAMSRLKIRQEEANIRSVNVFAILWYRLLEIVSFVPLIVNIYWARNNCEMIALILVSNYAIDCVIGRLSDIAEGVIEYFAQKRIIKPLKGDDRKDRPTLEHSIVLNKVAFDYGKDTESFVIDHLEFPKDSRTLVTGESGEGKSTLANLLAGAITPNEGVVPFYAMYYIWQETEILDDTLWNNVVFDNPEGITEDEVMELFDRLNMKEWFGTLKDGFGTLVGERGCRLSSGQKQRLNIVRLVLSMRYHPEKVFVIDEITSNLDSKTRDLAIDLIDNECKSTLICISHNDGFDRICQNHIVVENHRFNVVI